MPNPLFNALGGPQAQMGGPMNVAQSFQQFMGQMRGKDPNAMLNELMTSGKINQAQLNQAQQMAKQMEGQLNGIKSMFGF